MKKIKLSAVLGIIVALSISTVAMAAAPTCKTWIWNSGKSASGSTSLFSATYCSTLVVASYKTGGEVRDFATGIAGASATAHASGTKTFNFAFSEHYAEDSAGAYRDTTTATY